MMSIAVFARQLLLVSILVLSQQRSQALAGWLSTSTSVVAPVQQAGVEPNMTLAGYYAQVQETIQSIESKPRCSRLAHKALINACGTYDKHRDHVFQKTDEAVDAFRKHFAIQMTACEMEDLQEEMPAACQPLLGPLTNDPRRDIPACLKSLKADHNSWTSLELNKHHGSFMCYAMRAEVDKEEQLDNTRKMFNIVLGMGRVVQEQSESMDYLTQASHALGSELRKAFETLQHENEKLKADVKQSFGEVAKDLSNMGEGMNSLLSSLGQVDKEFQQHSAHLNEMFNRMMSLSTDVDTWSTDVAKVQEESQELHSMMNMRFQQLLADTFKSVHELTADMAEANKAVGNLASQMDIINNDMEQSLTKVQGINIAADGAQHKFQNFQQQLQDMQEQTNLTQESIQIVNMQVESWKSYATTASVALSGFNWFIALVKHFGLYFMLAMGILMLMFSRIGIELLLNTAISFALGIPVAGLIFMPLFQPNKASTPEEAVFQDELETQWQLRAAGWVLAGFFLTKAYDRFKRWWTGRGEVDLPTTEKSFP